MWTLIFLPRMLIKDYSLSKKEGWKDYQETSWMLPFKFGGSTVISIIIYSIAFSVIYFCLSTGGIEKGIKSLIN